MSRMIEITVAPDGQTRVVTKGFNGNQCRDASRFIEAALGQTTSDTLTAEFHQHSQQQNHLEQEP